MKAIVLACRDISEDTDNLQSDMGFKWSQSEISDINYLKDELQESVENLVKACKTLASGDSSLPKTVLENIARKLMNVSRDLVSAVNRAVDFSGGGGSGRGGGGSSSQNNNNFNQMQQRQPLQEAPKQSTAYNNTQSQVTSIYDQNDRSYFSDDYNQRSDNRYTRDTDLSYNDGGGAEPLNIPSLKVSYT